jgi:hypothetical protein
VDKYKLHEKISLGAHFKSGARTWAAALNMALNMLLWSTQRFLKCLEGRQKAKKARQRVRGNIVDEELIIYLKILKYSKS